MSGRVVAILGVSGVGKTSMVSAYSRHYPSVHSVRASTLLKAAVLVPDTETLRTAPAPEIHDNQVRLASAFSELRSRYPERNIIFDGHSLIDNDETLVIVPVATFIQLAPNLIVFLEDDPEAIHVRRNMDEERLRPNRSVDEIATHQQTAKEAAFSYGAALSAPCLAVWSGDHASFRAALNQTFAF